MAQPANCAGFFGKVTSHGDFVSRRLPADFLAFWDHWLQEGLMHSRTQMGSRWLDTYLNSPIWRFAVSAHICDGNSWAGVVMPSVDRVGRHFPLTVACGVRGDAPLLDWLLKGSAWFDVVETHALSTLDAHFDLAKFDHDLCDVLPLPVTVSSERPAFQGSFIRVAGIEAMSAAMPSLVRQIAQASMAGSSLWWTDGSPQVEPSVVVCRGMPTNAMFCAMLGGDQGQFVPP